MMNTTIRDLVLSHPDLAARLTEPPLGYSDPRQWTGFIPPDRLCTGALNNSPRRTALLEIIAEARRREAAAAETARLGRTA